VANKRQARMKLTLEIFKETTGLIEQIEKSYTILKHDLDEEGLIYVPEDSKDQYTHKEKFDTVVTVGIFLNRVALLCLCWKVDYWLIKKNNIFNILTTFTYLLKKNKFKTQTYDVKSVQESTDWPFIDWEIGWPFLNDYMQNKKYWRKKLLELLF
jgi:hypothetical protein